MTSQKIITSVRMPSRLTQFAARLGAALHPRRGSTSRVLLGAALAVACGQAVSPPQVSVFNHASSKLSLGTLNEINGTYTTCIHHSDDDPWSAPIGGFSGLDNPALSVVEGDSNCQLTVTSILIDADSYVPTSPFVMSDSYLNNGVAFRKIDAMTGMPVSEIAFYGNMKLSSASFAYGFSMSLVYSDDARLTSGGSANSEYRTTSAAASEGQTSPPDYTADSSTLAIQTDAAKKITAVSGAVDLAHHSVQGQNYVISSASLAATPTFDALNTAYNAGTPVSIQNNSDPSVAASALGLVNETGLATGSVKRHIILRNLDSNTGTVAYQLITVTIIPPT